MQLRGLSVTWSAPAARTAVAPPTVSVIKDTTNTILMTCPAWVSPVCLSMIVCLDAKLLVIFSNILN